jgi:hypothetical protein
MNLFGAASGHLVRNVAEGGDDRLVKDACLEWIGAFGVVLVYHGLDVGCLSLNALRLIALVSWVFAAVHLVPQIGCGVPLGSGTALVYATLVPLQCRTSAALSFATAVAHCQLRSVYHQICYK